MWECSRPVLTPLYPYTLIVVREPRGEGQEATEVCHPQHMGSSFQDRASVSHSLGGPRIPQQYSASPWAKCFFVCSQRVWRPGGEASVFQIVLWVQALGTSS